jgi:phosphatidylcholine synthase
MCGAFLEHWLNSMSLRNKLPAVAVHLLTASGAVLGLEALAAAAAHQFELAMGWLGVALFVDAADGPLARRFNVKKHLPRFCGERLDLIIDYLNYVAAPAFIAERAGLFPDGAGFAGAALMLLVSLFHFSDTQSKTHDGYFVGFPAVWNVVVLYLLVTPLPKSAALALVTALALLTFVPVKYVHPVRVRNWRPITSLVTIGWSAAAIAATVRGFPGDALVQAVFAASAIYFIALGLSRSVKPRAQPAE